MTAITEPSISGLFIRFITGFTVMKIDAETWRFTWRPADALWGWIAIGFGHVLGRYF